MYNKFVRFVDNAVDFTFAIIAFVAVCFVWFIILSIVCLVIYGVWYYI